MKTTLIFLSLIFILSIGKGQENKYIDLKEISIAELGYSSSILDYKKVLGSPLTEIDDYDHEHETPLTILKYEGIEFIFSHINEDITELTYITIFEESSYILSIEGQDFTVGDDSLKVSSFAKKFSKSQFSASRNSSQFRIEFKKYASKDIINFWLNSDYPQLVEEDEKGKYIPYGSVVFEIKEGEISKISMTFMLFI